jgi:predicted RNase H-like HicB family nuclease
MKLVVRIAREPTGEYRAWCPMLPGCDAQGASRDEALANMDSAVRGYLACLNVVVPMESGRLFVATR